MSLSSLARQCRAASRLALFLAVSIAFAFLYMLTMPLSRARQLGVQRRWCGAVSWAAGLRTIATGVRASHEHPVIYLVNHVSYFDIPAFGRLVPATFVAKSEVASWPLFGWLARLTGTLFIPRRAGRSAAQVTLLRTRLARGESLILFPEGTNSDGTSVLPFKSSLLESVAIEAAGTAATAVQPVSLAYTRLATGEPLTGVRRDLYAWVGVDDMLPHLWRALGSPGALVRVHFHEPLPAEVLADRKCLARTAEDRVRSGLEALWRDIEPETTTD